MCGINAITVLNNNKQDNVFFDLYESLFHLQHRGQDSVGISVINNTQIYKLKTIGLIDKIKNNFICGKTALGHVRYSTSNFEKFSKESQIQPFYKEKKHNIVFCHNGHVEIDDNIKNYCIKNKIILDDLCSDSEIILEILLNELSFFDTFNNQNISTIIEKCCSLWKGSFCIICYIKNYGLICFKDNQGIRPLSYGVKNDKLLISSESVALTSLNYSFKELHPQEILIITEKTQKYKIICKKSKCILKPCVFEWIYLARTESVIYNIQVYQCRMIMGRLLANEIKRHLPNYKDYDYIVPIPDSSRPYAQSISNILNIPYMEAIQKNRYIFRTFIMNTQNMREKNIKRKLNVIPHLVKNKNIIIVDDSIVRGNTMNHIVKLLKNTEVNKITIVSAAPPIINVNKYGIDLPDRKDLISYHYNSLQLKEYYNVDCVIFQTKKNLLKAINYLNNNIKNLETSIFDN